MDLPSPTDDHMHDIELTSSHGPLYEVSKDLYPILPPPRGRPSSSSTYPTLTSPSSSAAPHDDFTGASISSAVFNLSNSIVGAGIMGLPATFRSLGLVLGFVMLLLVGWLNQISITMLIKTSAVQHVWSYTDLIHQEFGSQWRLGLVISVIINNFGICIVYLIIIADVLSGTIPGTGVKHTGLLVSWNDGATSWWSSRYLVIIITMIVILGPLVSLKHVDSLHYTSALSIGLAIFFVVVTVVVTAINLVNGRIEVPRFWPDVGSSSAAWALCNVIPVMATAYVCHFNVHPIYVELKDRREETMIRVSRISLTFCTIVYVFTSISGYLLFGDDTATDVLVNFDKNLGIVSSSALNDIVRIAYVLHVMLVFPVIYYSLRAITDSFLFPTASVPLLEDNRRFYVITVVQMALIYLGAVVVPNIWMAFEITGATTTMLIGMVFPALVALRDQSGIIVPWEKNTAWFMLVFAIVVSVTGIMSSIYYITQDTAGVLSDQVKN